MSDTQVTVEVKAHSAVGDRNRRLCSVKTSIVGVRTYQWTAKFVRFGSEWRMRPFHSSEIVADFVAHLPDDSRWRDELLDACERSALSCILALDEAAP